MCSSSLTLSSTLNTPKDFPSITEYMEYIKKNSDLLFPLPCVCAKEEKNRIMYSQRSEEHQIEKVLYSLKKNIMNETDSSYSHNNVIHFSNVDDIQLISLKEQKEKDNKNQQNKIPQINNSTIFENYYYGNCQWCQLMQWLLIYLPQQFHKTYSTSSDSF